MINTNSTELEREQLIGMDYYMKPEVYQDTQRQREKERYKENFLLTELMHLRLLFYRGEFEF